MRAKVDDRSQDCVQATDKVRVRSSNEAGYEYEVWRVAQAMLLICSLRTDRMHVDR